MKYLNIYYQNVKTFIDTPVVYWRMARAAGYSNIHLAADAAITVVGSSAIAGIIYYYM